MTASQQENLRRTAFDAIRHSYHVLSRESDLSPHNAKITETLTHLVRTLTHCQHCPAVCEDLLNAPDLATERACLPELCGRAECAMEKFWARKFIADATPDLNQFWYMAEYRALCDAEMELFRHRSYARISFLGSGALPLTAFILAQRFPATKIVCVDYDAEACVLASTLAEKLELDIDVIRMDAKDYRPVVNELVICASLLCGGMTVYETLSRQPDCDLLLRDSESAYRFLYKQARLPEAHFREVSKTGTDARRINTSRYYRQDALAKVEEIDRA